MRARRAGNLEPAVAFLPLCAKLIRVTDHVLGRIQHAARYGRVIPTQHARERMRLRNADPRDVDSAIHSATVAIEQDEGAVRLEGGSDLDGDPLTVVVREIRPGLLVITVI